MMSLDRDEVMDCLMGSTLTIAGFEKEYIISVLKQCNGKVSGVSGAAVILGIPHTTLHSKIKKLGITKADIFG